METALEKVVFSLSLEEKDGEDAPLVPIPKRQKRKRLIGEDDEELEEDDDEQVKMIIIENTCSSTPWISIFNSRPPMIQRYHNNVTNLRLHHNVEKANKDGLFISCVASQANLWTFIADSETGFTSQVYKLSPFFMHKEWIMEQWEKKYFISSIAGAKCGTTLVVMSKGTPYTLQSYKISDSFPFNWINKKWEEGFHVTSMGTFRSCRWCIVVSKNSGYSEQVVEIDSLYPSEAIKLRLASGYKITSMAATKTQAAFILSIPKEKMTDEEETQETLCTSDFPSAYLKEQWKKHRYVSLICYGETKSGYDSNGGPEQKRSRSGHSDDLGDDEVHNALASLHISDENPPQSGTCEEQVCKTTSNIENST